MEDSDDEEQENVLQSSPYPDVGDERLLALEALLAAMLRAALQKL